MESNVIKYYILKEFIPSSETAWAIKLNDEDPAYIYSTLVEAEEALPTIQLSYPDRKLKIFPMSVSQ
jgi:hypothetical protein